MKASVTAWLGIVRPLTEEAVQAMSREQLMRCLNDITLELSKFYVDGSHLSRQELELSRTTKEAEYTLIVKEIDRRLILFQELAARKDDDTPMDRAKRYFTIVTDADPSLVDIDFMAFYKREVLSYYGG